MARNLGVRASSQRPLFHFLLILLGSSFGIFSPCEIAAAAVVSSRNHSNMKANVENAESGAEIPPTPVIYKFPPDFVFSTATAAYQVEGGADEDGRGASIWDTFCRIDGKIVDGSNGDVACDSYHKYREDVKLLKEIGVQQYRFSLSWTRILPTGRPDSLNSRGIAYYHALIDELHRSGIEPVVTMYHWDLPQALQDRGGWLNGQIVEWFTDYARVLFENFGSKVKTWITLNEPYIHTMHGHCMPIMEHAPGGLQAHCSWVPYQVGHNMLLAHASVYHMFKREFSNKHPGKIGISNVGTWMEPASEKDRKAAQRAFDMQFGWFCHPLFSAEGDYPASMKEHLEKLSKKEGRTVSRLPKFNKTEIDFVKGAADFLGLNYYITLRVTEMENGKKAPESMLNEDIRAFGDYDPAWKHIGGHESWIRRTPFGLREILNFVRTNYDNFPVLITENGCMDTPGEGLQDVSRVAFVREHLIAVLKAIDDGCNVLGYTLWSLMDNFEWSNGYTVLFGIHQVNFTDPERARTPKASALFYQDVIRTREVEETTDVTPSAPVAFQKRNVQLG